MWASSRIQFQQPLQVNCSIEKASTIADVVLKHSDTSGPLLFVHIDHAYAQGSEALLRERQTIVYRQPPSTRPAGSHTQEAPQRNSMHSVEVIPDSTLLFRYSALTFNGHRIHYDHNYATSVEGYPGLVVQGPLTATLLMNLAQAIWPDKPLREFDFRGVAPAFVDQPLVLSTSSGAASDHVDTDSTVHLEGRDHRGALIMRAVAQF
jgi:3-methylfumaryl-CoA hydratase